jgi:hypothetical protein
VAVESGAAKTLPALFQQAGITAITLGPAWRRVPAEKHNVSRLDPHPSAEVHREFASTLFEELRARGWLDASARP